MKTDITTHKAQNILSWYISFSQHYELNIEYMSLLAQSYT